MSTSRRSVGVLGGGEWGLALARGAAAAGSPTYLYTRRSLDHLPQGVQPLPDIATLAATCPLLVVAVPSPVARDVMQRLGDVVDGHHAVVHAIRGLSDEGLLTVSAIVREETPVRRVGAFAGPALAADLLADRPCVIAVASRYPEVLRAVQEGFGSPTLRVSEIPDLVGVEWASALTGIVLLGLGFAHAVGVRGGLLAGLCTRAMHEAARIGVAAGAEEATFWTIAGIGDVMAAMIQLESRPEVSFGRAFAETGSMERARDVAGARIEALELLPRVLAFARSTGIHAAVFEGLGEILAGRATTDQLLLGLMRAARHGP